MGYYLLNAFTYSVYVINQRFEDSLSDHFQRGENPWVWNVFLSVNTEADFCNFLLNCTFTEKSKADFPVLTVTWCVSNK